MKTTEPVIKISRQGPILYWQDPMPFLIKRELAAQVGNGLFVLRGTLVKILCRIEKLICDIAEKTTAAEVSVPSILSYENTQRSRYLKSFKNQALIINPYFHHDEEPLGMLSPTVCYHYFSSLKNSSITKNLTISAISKCSRREKGKLNNLSRLTNFTMREIVFLGTEEFCLKKRKEVLQSTEKVLKSSLDLSYRVVTASDPFFGRQGKAKERAQLLAKSKYEMQTFIPFNQTYLSIASFNNHGKVFFDRFKITSTKPELSFSGCTGWGYERILYSILAQKGVDFTTTYYQKLLK